LRDFVPSTIKSLKIAKGFIFLKNFLKILRWVDIIITDSDILCKWIWGGEIILFFGEKNFYFCEKLRKYDFILP